MGQCRGALFTYVERSTFNVQQEEPLLPLPVPRSAFPCNFPFRVTRHASAAASLTHRFLTLTNAEVNHVIIIVLI